MQLVVTTNTVAETEAVGQALAKQLSAGDIVAMYGDLGAGKTAFVRGMARGLDSQDPVSSPTFTIVNEYSGRLKLYHFDAYRLASSDELYDIGWDDYTGSGGVCVVEWSENISDIYDGTQTSVKIERISETGRKITIGRAGE